MNKLSRLIGKYVGNDSPTDAFDAVNDQNYELMRRFTEGVPSGVMFSAMTATVERTSEVLAEMIVDTMREQRGWDDEQAATQLGLTLMMMRLLAADSLNQILQATAPTETDERTEDDA